jgi:hypothetical protein
MNKMFYLLVSVGIAVVVADVVCSGGFGVGL